MSGSNAAIHLSTHHFVCTFRNVGAGNKHVKESVDSGLELLAVKEEVSNRGDTISKYLIGELLCE